MSRNVIDDAQTGVSLPVLLDERPLFAVNKPCGLVTQGATAGQPSAVEIVKRYIQRVENKPGKVWLGVCHRLDRETSGTLVFARNSKAASRLAKQFRQRTVEKHYLAVVEGGPTAAKGTFTDWLLQRPQDRQVRSVPADTQEARQALLHYRVLARKQGRTLLRIELETGRKHQIRVQLASRGWPILGDAKYGGKPVRRRRPRESAATGIALHAWRMTLAHPIRKTQVAITAQVPGNWEKWGFSMNRLFDSQ